MVSEQEQSQSVQRNDFLEKHETSWVLAKTQPRPKTNRTTAATSQPFAQQQQQKKDDDERSKAVLLFVLGFFLVVPWIVQFCTFQNSTDSLVRTLNVFALALFIVSSAFLLALALLVALFFVIWVIGVSNSL